jgi:hypothetical protein
LGDSASPYTQPLTEFSFQRASIRFLSDTGMNLKRYSQKSVVELIASEAFIA